MGCGAEAPRSRDSPMAETGPSAPSASATSATPGGKTQPGSSQQEKSKPARRPPAQKAAHEAGLAGDVFLHKDALGGFTESGRKPKRLKPADLTEKPKRKRKSKVLASADPAETKPRATGQRELPSADA